MSDTTEKTNDTPVYETWFEAAEAQEGEVEYHDYPLYVINMALVEQQKRTADALERIATMAEHALTKYVGGRVREQAEPKLYAAINPDSRFGAQFAFHADDYHDAYRKMAGWNKAEGTGYTILGITEDELDDLGTSIHDEYVEKF